MSTAQLFVVPVLDGPLSVVRPVSVMASGGGRSLLVRSGVHLSNVVDHDLLVVADSLDATSTAAHALDVRMVNRLLTL